MPFTDPFVRIKDLDEKTFHRVNVANFRDLENMPQQFTAAINDLSDIREALTVAAQGGMIENFQSGKQFYIDALNWLRLNHGIINGVAVQAITSYSEINDQIADSFYQYVQWFKNNHLANQQLYQNIQVQLGIKKTDTLKALDLKAEELHRKFKEDLYEAQKQQAEHAERKKQELGEELIRQFNAQNENISSNAVSVLASIRQAQSLNIWHESYINNIKRYEQKISGQPWISLDSRGRLKNLTNKLSRAYSRRKELLTKEQSAARKNILILEREIRFIWYVGSRTIRYIWNLIIEVLKFTFSKFFSAKFQRFSWFTLLAVVLVGQSLLFLLLILNGSIVDVPITEIFSSNALNNLTSNEFIFTKLSIAAGLILVPSLGYAAANKNYRIYSNLLEQYMHRATVAQTLQGILRNISEGEDNKDIRMSLTAVAAVAMFELKNVGHLSKKDGETLPLAEILQSVLKK